MSSRGNTRSAGPLGGATCAAVSLPRVSILLALSALQISCARPPSDTAVAQSQGRSVEFSAKGRGSPAVVFEAGLGDSLSSWDAVLPAVAAHTRVIAYSRPGYGRSDRATAPRDVATVAAELRRLLQSIGERPPYVLVGHSLGGLYVRAYAALYPQDVVGLVLVDPTHPDILQRMDREAPTDAWLFGAVGGMFFGVRRDELRALETSAAFFSEHAPYTGFTIALGAQRVGRFSSDRLVPLKRELLEETVATLADGEARWVDTSHYIQREQPNAVVTAILAALARAQATRD